MMLGSCNSDIADLSLPSLGMRIICRSLTNVLVFTMMFVTVNTVVAETGSEESQHGERSSPDMPLVVDFDFELLDINDVDVIKETVEFTGVLTLRWRDPSYQLANVESSLGDRVYQGKAQTMDVFRGWFPQVALVNSGGLYEELASILTITPAGRLTLRKQINAIAEVNLDMRRFPFDAHQLDLQFSIFGYDANRVRLQGSERTQDNVNRLRIPEWSFIGAWQTSDTEGFPGEAPGSGASSVTIGLKLKRKPLYVLRLVSLPMAVLVFLSFTIFWMDQSSLADRNNVSFIGILTGVAYQQLIMDIMPPVSYATYMNSMLFASFFLMSLTVPVNVLVASMDKRGRPQMGDRIDATCRWLFPMVHVLLILLFVTRAFSIPSKA